MKRINYKIILIVWLAIGTAISGVFLINPPTYNSTYKKESIDWENPRRGFKVEYIPTKSKNTLPFKYSVLITLVGIILIGGIGYVTDKKK